MVVNLYIYENGEYVYKVLSNSSYNEKQTIERGKNQIGCEMFLKCSFQRWKGEQGQKRLLGWCVFDGSHFDLF